VEHLTRGLRLTIIQFRGLQKLFDDWGVFQGLQVSGQNSFTLQADTIEGSRSAYEGQRWDTDPLVRRSSLHIEGPVWRNFGLQMDISSSGWGSSYTRYVLGWTTDETALYYGDLNIRLAGNEFASFNKTLAGWQIDQMLPGGGLLRGFYSEEKGLTRRQVINGNNTSGPYFLTYTPIVDGSEIIKVDEQVLRFGRDYRLDYETGQLYFEPVDSPPRIIPSTSVISASYQSFGWQASPGSLYGARAEMPLLDGRMRVGVTALKQDKREAGDASDTAGFQEDIFQGSGSTGPFDVNYRPILVNGASVIYQGERQSITQPLVVLVDNVEQLEGVDYDSYRQIGRIIFRRAVPPTALVIIRYYYDLGQSELTGDQEVMGIDLGYRINDNLVMRTDYAQSRASDSGSAWRSSLQYSVPRVNAMLELRNVNSGFTYIDSVGFQRNEKGMNFSGQWQLNRFISLSDRYSDLSSNQGLTFGYSGGYGSYGGIGTFGVSPAQTTTTSLDVQTKRHDVMVDVRYPDWPTLSLSRQTLENTGGSRGNSNQTTDSANVNWSPSGKPFTVSLRLSDTGQRYFGLTGDDGSATPSGSSTSQMQTALTYSPSQSLSLNANYGHNTSTSLGADDKSTSDVTQLALQWNPTNRINVSLNHTMSESLGQVSSGFYGGGYGSYPYQVSPGLPDLGGGGSGDDDDDDEPTRYEDTNTSMNLSYRPADNLTLSLGGGRRKYTSGGGVGYLADSNQEYYNLSAGWQPTSELSVSATLGSDEMKFLEEGRGAVINDMLAVGVNYRPLDKPWGVSLNFNSQSGSSPTYIGFGDNQISRTVPTDLLDLSGQVTWEMADGAQLYAQLGRARYESGYANFQKDQGEFGVRYRASSMADFSLSYRYIRNIAWDPDLPLPGFSTATTASQNYIAHNFMLGVTSNFHSGLGGSSNADSAAGLRSFGGYQTGSPFGGSYTNYGSGGFGSSRGGFNTGGYGSYGSGGYGQSGFGQTGFGSSGTYGSGGLGSYGTGSQGGFSSGWTDTRGSSSQYYGSRRSSGFETGLGQFEQPGADGRTPTERPPGDMTGPPRPDGDQPPPAPFDHDDDRRWWQWYD
jgi:hypothetical protein